MHISGGSENLQGGKYHVTFIYINSGKQVTYKEQFSSAGQEIPISCKDGRQSFLTFSHSPLQTRMGLGTCSEHNGM